MANISFGRACRDRVRDSAIWMLALTAVGFFGFPVLWMVLTSLKPDSAIAASAPVWLFTPILDNYHRIFTDQPLGQMIGHSALISLASTALSVIAGAAAAYGMAKLKPIGRPALTIWFLFQRAVPPVVMFVPLYVLFHNFGLLNTHLGLILAYTTFELPFVVLTMVSFFDEVPPEIGEAAMLDGCSAWQRFRLVELPLVLPGLAPTTFFCLLFSWNEFILAKIIAGPDTVTLPLAVNTYLFAFGSGGTVPWGPLAAVGTIIIFPVFAATLVMQKYLVRGMTLGAVK